MSRCRRLVLVALIAGAGCGDNLSGGPGGIADGPGPFDSPSDFDQAAIGCTRFALAGYGEGIYHFAADFGDGYVSTGASRLDELGPWQFGGVLAGHAADRAWADDQVLFLHTTLDGELGTRSLLLCDGDGDELRGAYAYCRDGECYLATVTAARVDRLVEAPAAGLTLIGEYGDPSWGPGGVSVNVRVDGDLAYLARYHDGLRILDISDPARPVEVGHAPTEHGEIYNDVKVVSAGGRRYALMASNEVGLVVWDVTTPSAPAIVAHVGTPIMLGEGTNIHTVFVDGGRAYLGNTRRGLEIWDLADPTAPRKLGELRTPPASPDGAFLHDLYVEGDRAYLNFWSGGMVIADVSDPAAPRVVGTFAGYGETSSHSSWVTTVGGRRVAAHGDEQWGSHLRLVDVTEGTDGFARQLGEWQTRREVSIHNVMALGSEVIAAHYQDGVRIIDITDPTAPRQTAWFNTWPGYDRRHGESFYEGAIGIDVDRARGRVYVADSHRGLLILQR